VNRSFAALYDWENYTECDGEQADAAGNEALAARALASCILWQHHKWVKYILNEIQT